MRKSRFTEQQIVAIVRESEREGVTVGQVAKKHGITETTLFRWRKRFSGLTGVPRNQWTPWLRPL